MPFGDIGLNHSAAFTFTSFSHRGPWLVELAVVDIEETLMCSKSRHGTEGERDERQAAQHEPRFEPIQSQNMDGFPCKHANPLNNQGAP